MASEAVDLATVLNQIQDIATRGTGGTPDAMRTALDEIVTLASRRIGDTPEPSDIPQTENQSL